MKYKDSGVDIDKANRATKLINESVRATWNPNVLSEVGNFGGLFRFAAADYEDPVLVSSVDGVGTKLIVAARAQRYETIGQDLVNHCVNDILAQGAKPLFFLDYIAAGSLHPSRIAELVEGLSTACRENGCALVGGETAEMPDLYRDDDFDLAGTIVGVVDRKRLIDGKDIAPGDRLFVLPSSGLHTNGYSLARAIVFEQLGMEVGDAVDAFGCTVGEELLKVHRSYLAPVTALMEQVAVRGLAHITGGGITENVPRILPGGVDARFERGSWPVPPVFTFLQEGGGVSQEEMDRVFNMGAGMVVVVAASDADRVPGAIAEHTLHPAGEIVAGQGRAVFG